MQIPLDAIRDAAERMAPQLATVKLRDGASRERGVRVKVCA